MKAFICFSLFILTLMLYAGQSFSQENKINKIYLNNGSTIACDDAWLCGDKSNSVCYVKGNKGLRISLVEIDKEKTFGTEQMILEKNTLHDDEITSETVQYPLKNRTSLDKEETSIVPGREVIVDKKDSWREAIYDGSIIKGWSVDVSLADGININEPIDDKGNTPLHIAVAKDNWKLIRWLIDHGADINAKNNKGEVSKIPFDVNPSPLAGIHLNENNNGSNDDDEWATDVNGMRAYNKRTGAIAPGAATLDFNRWRNSEHVWIDNRY